MAAVLACGRAAVLSHESAAALWQIRAAIRRRVEVSVPSHVDRRPSGILVHRRAALAAGHVAERHGIPVTGPILTLVDIAPRLSRDRLEAAIGEADKRELVDPETLRAALEGFPPVPGVATLRRTLDRHTFTLTDSELERRFLPIARRAGLPPPKTQVRLNGFRVDFFWPDLGLVVETDGLRYHRTPAAQTADAVRSQVHTAAGLTPLRFTHYQVASQPSDVEGKLVRVASRLRRETP